MPSWQQGFITVLAPVTLDVAVAVVLSRSLRRGWRERHRGAAFLTYQPVRDS